MGEGSRKFVVMAAAAAVLTLFAGGCGPRNIKAQPVTQEETVSGDRIVYLIPKGTAIQNSSGRGDGAFRHYIPALKGIYFPLVENSTAMNGKHKSVQTYCEGNRMSGAVACLREYSDDGRSVRSRARSWYDIGVASEEGAEVVKVALTPQVHRWRDYRDFLVDMEAPAYSVDDVCDTLAKTRMTLKIEVDSKYPTEATIANFKRMLVRKMRNPFEWDGTMCLKDAKYPAEIRYQVVPYRTGSKAIVTAEVDLGVTSTEPGVKKVDVGEILAETTKAIEKIVQD